MSSFCLCYISLSYFGVYLLKNGADRHHNPAKLTTASNHLWGSLCQWRDFTMIGVCSFYPFGVVIWQDVSNMSLQSRLCLLCVAKIYKNPQLSQLLAAYCVTINYVNLQIYRPYDARYPVVCMDEKPMQLLADARKGDAKRTVPIFKTANTSETEHAVSSCLPSLSPGSAMLRLWSIVRRLTGPDR